MNGYAQQQEQINTGTDQNVEFYTHKSNFQILTSSAVDIVLILRWLMYRYDNNLWSMEWDKIKNAFFVS